MKQLFARAAVAALLICSSIVQARGFQPPQGYVPDSKTAIRIAVAVLSPIYGEKQIQSEKPFHASLKHGVWTVNGSLPNPTAGGKVVAGYHAVVVGGTALIQISKKDGHILFVMHGK